MRWRRRGNAEAPPPNAAATLASLHTALLSSSKLRPRDIETLVRSHLALAAMALSSASRHSSPAASDSFVAEARGHTDLAAAVLAAAARFGYLEEVAEGSAGEEVAEGSADSLRTAETPNQ